VWLCMRGSLIDWETGIFALHIELKKMPKCVHWLSCCILITGQCLILTSVFRRDCLVYDK
jgi:hypothetical protein